MNAWISFLTSVVVVACAGDGIPAISIIIHLVVAGAGAEVIGLLLVFGAWCCCCCCCFCCACA